MLAHSLTILKKYGLSAFIRRTFSFLDTRFLLLVSTFAPKSAQQKIINKILNKQSSDLGALELNAMISQVISETENIHIVVPNFLKPVFQLSTKFRTDVSISSYSDMSEKTDLIDRTLVVLHAPMLNQIHSLKDIVSSLECFLTNGGYEVRANMDLPAEKMAGTMRWPEFSTDSQVQMHGFNFSIRPNTMDRAIIGEVKGEYINWIESQTNKTFKTVFDVGSHIGSFAVQVTQFLEEKGRVFSYEPVPDNFKLVSENIKQNSLQERVFAFEKAMSNEPGKATIHISSDNTGGSRLHSPDPSSQSSVEVEVTTLNNEIQAHGVDEIDLLKVDVEGSESQILFSSKDTIQNKVKYIICEAGGSVSSGGNEVLEFLKSCDFETEHHGNDALMLIYAKNKRMELRASN